MALEKTKALYSDLAKALGATELKPDDNGGIQLTVGEDNSVVMYGEDDVTFLVIVPVAPLPREPDFGVVTWMLRRNLFDSELQPFRIAADDNGNVILWGRLMVETTTGEDLARIIDAAAAEAETIRAEVGMEAEA